MDNKNTQLIKIVYANRFFIFLTAALFALATIVFTSKNFMPPVYSSEVIFYPPSAAINRSFDNVKSFMVNDKEIEEHLQTILSGKTEETLTKKYHLVSHYDIDTSETDWRDELKKEWQNNFRVSRTRYNSISIVIYDTDKNLAAQIANDAARIADSIKNTLLKDNLKQNFEAMHRQLVSKFAEVDSASKLLGIDASAIAFSPSLTGNATVDLAQKQQTISNLFISKKKSVSSSGQLQLYSFASLLRQLYDLESAVSQLNVAIAAPPLSSFILSPAQPSYKKSSPKRTLLTAVSFFGGLFFGLAYILFGAQWTPIKTHLN